MAGEPGAYDSINVAGKLERLSAGTGLACTCRPTENAGGAHRRPGSRQPDLRTGRKAGLPAHFPLIFAYVALVVGAFIIFNTFSITVAQRTREFGLLRTLGASRGQIMRTVVQEGLLLGVIGAVIGLLLGILLAPALDGLFKAFGADLPDNGTVLEARTVIVSLGVGIIVTVLAGLFPAMRATRVPPIAAMREGVQIPPRPLPTRRTLIIRFVLGLLLIFGLGAVIGHGIGLLLVILWTLARQTGVRLRRKGERPARRYRVIPALGRAIGSLVAWRGITGRLARENSVRQPGRTLVTALALTVGLGLVTFISVLAAGTKTTIDNAVNRSFAGNLIVQNSHNEGGIPAAVAPAVRQVHGVGDGHRDRLHEGQSAQRSTGCTGDRRKERRDRD